MEKGGRRERKLDEDGVANCSIGALLFLMQSFGNFNWYWNEHRECVSLELWWVEPHHNGLSQIKTWRIKTINLLQWKLFVPAAVAVLHRRLRIQLPQFAKSILVQFFPTTQYIILCHGSWNEECNISLSISECALCILPNPCSPFLCLSHYIFKTFFMSENMINCLGPLNSIQCTYFIPCSYYYIETMEFPKQNRFDGIKACNVSL